MLLWTTDVDEQHYPLFDEFKESGFDGAEIPIAYDRPTEHFTHLRSVLDQSGLVATTTTALDASANPASADPAIRKAAVEHLRQAIEQSHAIGSDALVGPFHSAFKHFSGQGPTADELQWSRDVLREVADEAQEAGVVLNIEPLNRFECYLINTAQGGREHVDRVDHPAVRMLYDTHHMHIEEKDISSAIRLSADRIGHVHVSENDRGTPGSGQVNWVDTFACLKEAGYDGWFVIESFSRADPAFAAGIHVWRDYFSSRDEVYREGGPFIRRMWSGS